MPTETDEAFARRLQREEHVRSVSSRRAPAEWVASEGLTSIVSDVASEIPSRTGIGRMSVMTSLPSAMLSIDAVAGAEICGTASEPVFFLRDVDRCRGRWLAGRVLEELRSLGHSPPMPRQGARGGIVVEWHRRKRSATPWCTGVRALSDVAGELLARLRTDVSLAQRFPALQQSRPWNDSEVLVTTPGCTLGCHRDAQPEGSLLFIFCAGLSCRSSSWPAGRLVERTLESGDVMIFDGRRTMHAISGVLGGTSPMPECPWLGKRRLSVLVRQCPPS